MEHRLLKTKFLMFCLLLNTILSAQNIVNNIVKQVDTVVSKQNVTHKKFTLRHLVRSGISYLQVVEDDVVLLQVVEDDVVLLKHITNDSIKIRLSTKNNRTTAQFLKGKEILKTVVEDDVVLLKSVVEDDVMLLQVVEDDVVLLKSVVEDDVVLLQVVEDDVVLLKSKDSIKSYNINASKQINADSTKQIAYDRAQQIIHDSLRTIVPRSLGKISVGMSGGTKGLGIDLAYRILPRVVLRLGYNNWFSLLNFKGVDIAKFNILSIPKGKTAMSFNIDRSNIDLFADVSLTKKGGIRLTIGGMYDIKNQSSTTLRYNKEVAISDIRLTAGDVGYFTTLWTRKSAIAPYLGLGLGQLMSKRRINVNLDLGTYYRGSPVIKIEATNLLKRNVENEAALNRNLAAFKWSPVANLRIAYRIQ
jgi:hypothetical protein